MCDSSMSPVHTCLLHTHVSTCANPTHVQSPGHTHTHTQRPHGHLWQTLDVCEGSIQRPFRILGPVTLMSPCQVPADSPPLISGKCQGLPCSSHPAMPHLSRFAPSSLSPPSHVPQRAPRTKIPSKCYCLWVHSPPLSSREGRDCVGLVHGTAPAPGTQQAPSRCGMKKEQTGHSSAHAEQPRGHPVTPTSVHTQHPVCSSVLTHASCMYLHTCERAPCAHTCLSVSLFPRFPDGVNSGPWGLSPSLGHLRSL